VNVRAVGAHPSDLVRLRREYRPGERLHALVGARAQLGPHHAQRALVVRDHRRDPLAVEAASTPERVHVVAHAHLVVRQAEVAAAHAVALELAVEPPHVVDALPNRPEGYEKLSDEQLEQVAGAASPALAIMAVAGVGWGAFAIEGAVHAVATDD